jgi:hypothetical protein
MWWLSSRPGYIIQYLIPCSIVGPFDFSTNLLIYTHRPSSLPMGNATDPPVYGWVRSGDDRGTFDILWSCGTTILLCCWVSVYPNVGSPSDKWYHPFLDKLNLFCIALLGPDFLFGIAFGQWSKAIESVKVNKLLQPREIICYLLSIPFAYILYQILAIQRRSTDRR